MNKPFTLPVEVEPDLVNAVNADLSIPDKPKTDLIQPATENFFYYRGTFLV